MPIATNAREEYTFRPEGAATSQPRAERSAALGHRDQKHSALKGRYNGKARLKPDEIIADFIMHPSIQAAVLP